MMSRVAIVTGANKGIGLAIVKQLCEEFSGEVLLTARNSDRGEKALDEMKHQGYHNAVFHQLDVTSAPSIDKFRTFIEEKYGGLDILVNNAGISYGRDTTVPFPEQAREAIKVNFTAVVNVSNTLFPLLRPHGRVVNVGSSLGHLNVLSSDLQAKFSSDDVTVDQLVSLMSQFVSDAQAGTHTEKGWPNSAYRTSKVGLMALTRIQNREMVKSGKEDVLINLCCPGWVRTGMGGPTAHLSVEEGADTPVFLALLPPGSPSGQFFYKREVIEW